LREKLVRPCHVRAVGGAGLPTGLLDLPGVLFKTGRAPLTYLVFDLLCLEASI
jgi:hypothetical protein